MSLVQIKNKAAEQNSRSVYTKIQLLFSRYIYVGSHIPYGLCINLRLYHNPDDVGIADTGWDGNISHRSGKN
jgi:hypothetical protein